MRRHHFHRYRTRMTPIAQPSQGVPPSRTRGVAARPAGGRAAVLHVWLRARQILLAAGLSVMLGACSAQSPVPGPVPGPAPDRAGPAGHLLIVGGGRQPAELVARFVELSGGPGRARIAVIPLASGAPERSGAGKVADLERHGARAFVLQPDRATAESDSAARLLEDATGVWFTGGDQARITRVLSGTRLQTAILERYRGGAAIGGTSAGAAIMSDSMLTGEQVRAGEDTLGYHGDEYRRIERGAIRIVPGLGFLTGAIVDQHFVERERHNRLISVILERPTLLGVGIAESTAIEVGPDGSWTVLGAGSVVVFDPRAARITSGDARLGAAEVRMHVLPAGSRFDPRSGTARLPE